MRVLGPEFWGHLPARVARRQVSSAPAPKRLIIPVCKKLAPEYFSIEEMCH